MMRIYWICLLSAALLGVTGMTMTGAAGAILPLSAEHKKMLEPVTDGNAKIEEDALFALLENTSGWNDVSAIRAQPLNVEAVRGSPGEYRGSPMAITGQYLAEYGHYRTKRTGPWSGKLSQWGLQVPGGQVVAVYLVDPPEVPVKGRAVSLVGRFFKHVVRPKLNEDGSTDASKPQHFLVFVAKSAEVVRGDFPPPLSEGQKLQLSTATDYVFSVESGAFYALLQNVAKWSGATDPRAPIVRYREAIIAAPNDYRGLMFEIEGEFKGFRDPLKLSRPIRLAHSGELVEELEQWAIQINAELDDYVMVAVLRPMRAPKPGQRVRIPARFFKVYRNYNQDNQPLNYPFFVAYTAFDSKVAVSDSKKNEGLGGMFASRGLQLLVSGLAAVGIAFFIMKRFMKRASTAMKPEDLVASRREEREARRAKFLEEEGDQVEDEDDGPPLPEDPIDALSELDKRSQ
jgi:hypothetical protein